MRNQIKRMERLLAVLLTLALLLGELSPIFVVRAQGLSEDSQINSETSQTNNETSQTNNEISQTNNETSQTNDETSQTNDETSQTNDETSQTTDPVINPQQTTQNNEINTLAENVTDGIDLYVHNGGRVTLLGGGNYVAQNGSYSVGETSYKLHATQPLTQNTIVAVTDNVQATVILTDVNNADVFQIVLGDHATAELIISGNCGIASITLGNSAKLTISGGSLTLGSIAGEDSSVLALNSGTIVLSGSITGGTVAMSGTTVTGGSVHANQAMSLNNATLGQMGTVSSAGDLTAIGSVISTEMFGIQGGRGTVTLSGIGSVTADRVGALDEESLAYPGTKEMSITGTEYWDYTITYMNYSASGYSAWSSDDAPVSFRKQQAGANKTIVGYHTASGFVESNEVPLSAEPTRENYEFRGWSAVQMDASADDASDKTNAQWLAYDGKAWNEANGTIEESGAPAYSTGTIDAESGNVTFYAVYVPRCMIVQLHTNLTQDTVYAQFPAYVGAKGEDLQKYLDTQVYPVLGKEGQEAITFADAAVGGNAVNLVEFRIPAWQENGRYDLYAVWSSDMIQVGYLITTYYPNYTYQYKNENGEWVDIIGSNLNEVNDTLAQLLEEKYLTFGSAYGTLPELRLVPGAGTTESYIFVGWYVARPDGKLFVTPETIVGEGTVSDTALSTGSSSLFAEFENIRYDLTVSENSKWSFLDENGNVIPFERNGDGTKTAKVNSDTKVTMVRSDESTVASYWRLTNMKTAQLIWPEERASSDGGSYWLYYTFTMPQADVTAVYDEKVRWDTAMGDYIFGTYTINGHESYGIKVVDRTADPVTPRFFRWIMVNNKTTVYFTSSTPTDNQIVLDAETNLYLDGVHLTARSELLPQLKKFYEAGSSGVYRSDIAVHDFAQYQNIVVDNYPEHEQPYNASTSYKVNINLLDDSSVFAIGQRAWVNNVCNQWKKAYQTTFTITGDNHSLELYSLLYHGLATINYCDLKVLTAGEEYDNTIHWFHADSGGSSIKNSTVDASNRILFARLGGSLTGSGNGVSFTFANCTVTNGGTMHVPCFYVTNSELAADYIRINFYHYKFTDSTIRAKILGFEVGVHTSYANDFSILNNCDVAVEQWMSAARITIYGGTKLRVTEGIHLYESVLIYGSGTEVTAASLDRFRTYSGDTKYDGNQYAGDNSHHYFYARFYDGAKITITGNMDMGVKHNSMPTIEVYDAGTVLNVSGNADLVNTFCVNSGATVTVGGDLTLHQDLQVKDAGTSLTVNGNVYHVTEGTDDLYKSVMREDGSSERVYWSLWFDDQAMVTVGADVGSKTEADRTNVVYDRAATNLRFGGKVIRDIQVFYTVSDGYENAEENPDNIRVEEDIYKGENVVLQAPTKTGDTVVELEDNCWYSGATNVIGWQSNQAFASYDGFLRLTAKATGYALSLYYDQNVISGIRYQVEGSDWNAIATIPASGGTVKIPVDAKVEITVPASYATLVCAEALENGFYSPVELSSHTESDQCVITFTMDRVQIQFRALNLMQLYLDEGDIHIMENEGKVGFARYVGTAARFVPYGGDLVVTQKDTSVSCQNTLYISRNVAEETATVTLTGIVIKDNSGVRAHTVVFGSGVTAALHLKGTNALRNIKVPSTAKATILGAADAQTTFVKSALFSGNYLSTDNTLYYAYIGDNTSGQITLKGGTYISRANYNNQGTAVGFGSRTDPAQSITLENITFRYNSTSSHTPTFFRAGSKNITVKNCVLDITTNGSALFACANLDLQGGTVNYSYVATDYPRSVFTGVTNTVTVSGNAVVKDWYNGTSNNLVFANTPNQKLILCDTAQYITSGNLLQKQITVSGNAKLDVGNYIIAAQSIDISGGEVSCGALLSSGYVSTQADGAALIAGYVNGTNIQSSGTITISGGSVTAKGTKVKLVTAVDSEGVNATLPGIVGGSRGSKLNISGGTVTADHIGESGYVFGLFRVANYAVEDNYATGTQVHITDGVLDFEVLGGKASALTISGDAALTAPAHSRLEGASIQIQDSAQVCLPATATVGCADSTITISGEAKIFGVAGEGCGVIEAEGGTLVIQDTACVHVSRVNLTKGSIQVATTGKDLTSHYDYQGVVNNRSDKVGLFVDYGGIDAPTETDPMGSHAGDLAAQNITIGENAFVSAYRIGSNATLPDSGTLLLRPGSFIFSDSYGAYGSGNITVTKEQNARWSGDQLISVNYDFDTTDPVEMPEDAIYYYYYYASTMDNKVSLPTPERKGYRFDGWYYNASDTRIDEIALRDTDHYLTAKWTPINIWINLIGTEDNVQMSHWQPIAYSTKTVSYNSYILNSMLSIGYTADPSWQSVFTGDLLPAGTQLAVPSSLFDAYLAANGIHYDDGLSEDEKATLRILENLDTAEAVQNATGLTFPKLVAKWSRVQLKVTYNAMHTDVTQFRYGDTVRTINQIGTGKQEIIYYFENTYAQGYLGELQITDIPVPIRKGYNFVQWVNGEKALMVGDESKIVDSTVTEWTAQYKAKTYRVYLVPEKDGKIGALSSTDQLKKDEATGYYYFTATYDELFGAGNVTLPEAQVVGYVHQGWEILLKQDSREFSMPITEKTMLRWDESNSRLPDGTTTFSKGDTDGVFVLMPTMRSTKITYKLNGGSWTDAAMLGQYSGYVDQPLPTVRYLQTNGWYTIPEGNENSLKRHGYRFIGWTDEAGFNAWTQEKNTSAEDYFTQYPEKLLVNANVTYADVCYYAIWQPCSYEVVLHAWDTEADNQRWSNADIGGSVTVTYTGAKTVNVTQEGMVTLPSNADGFMTHTPEKGNPTTRQLLGWMFSDCDPVLNYYHSDGSIKRDYAEVVTQQMNAGAVFRNGETFWLPGVVSDPGDGGTIHMYAIYRERSLIFVQNTPDGEKTVLLIADYDVDRSGYVKVPTVAELEGYTLSGWYVNSEQPDAVRDYTWYGLESERHAQYSSENREENDTYIIRKNMSTGTYLVKAYVRESDANQKFDIYVNTYYAPQLNKTMTVYAQAGKSTVSAQNTYIIPETLQVPENVKFSYKVLTTADENDIVFVTKDVIDAWEGGDTWAFNGKTYHANNTFALELVASKDGASFVLPLVETTQTQTMNYLTQGYTLTVNVYSTNRLKDAGKVGSAKVIFSFPGLTGAEVTLDIVLRRLNAQYELNMDANVPDGEDFADISGWTAYDAERQGNIRYREFLFGASVNVLPKLELAGYTLVGWKDESGTMVDNSLDYAPAKNANTYLAQTLTAVWVKNRNPVTLDSNMQSNWNISFENADGSPVKITPNNGTYEVPYKTKVILTPKDGKEVNGYPEFIQGIALVENGTTATFTMPDSQVDLRFSRVKTLDVSGSSVTVTDNGYSLNGDNVKWRGDYCFTGTDAESIVIQTSNAPTANVAHAFLFQDLTADSILASKDVTLRFLGDTTLRRIDGGTNQLILAGEEGAQLNLLPDSGAAISANEVTLQDLSCVATLSNKHHTTATKVETKAICANTIRMENSTLDAVFASAIATYAGVILDGRTVEITEKSAVTAKANEGCPVSGAAFIGASSNLTVKQSTVDSEVGLETTGTVTISDSAQMNLEEKANLMAGQITVLDKSVLKAINSLVSGEQTIAASADVIDRNGRHLDMKSGAVTITSEGYQQDTRMMTEQSAYVLVGKAGNTVSITDPDQTVYMDGMKAGLVTINGKAVLKLLSASEIGGLTGAENADVTIQGDGPETVLTSTADIIAHNLTIQSCEIKAAGHRVGSMGAETEGNRIGTVVLSDTKITAKQVGALGAFQESFTTVRYNAASEIYGTLVQDHFRLSYELGSHAYSAENLPTVFRTTQTRHDGEQIPEALTNGYPARPIPDEGVTDYFLTWYILGQMRIAVGMEIPENHADAFAEEPIAITPACISYAEEAAEDGSRTLKIYGYFKASGTASIQPGRLYVFEKNAGSNAISVSGNEAWTVRFDVIDSTTDTHEYTVRFSQALPIGTRLILTVLEDTPRYYGYVTEKSVTALPLADFREMGTGAQPVFAGGTYSFLLAADYVDVSVERVKTEITLFSGRAKVDGIDPSATREAGSYLETKVACGDAKTAVLKLPDSDKPVLIVEFSDETVIPYTAEMTLIAGDVHISGQWFSGNCAIFRLAGSLADNYELTFSGLEEGSHTVDLYLAALTENGINRIYSSNVSSLTITQQSTVPRMKVTIDSESFAWQQGTEKTISYTIEKNVDSDVTVTLEKQDTIGSYKAETTEITVTDDAIVFPAILPYGTYRLCFSFNPHSSGDDVYYTFVVKEP